MSLEDYFRIGETIELGSHTFTVDEIKAFASKYDRSLSMSTRRPPSAAFSAACAPPGWHSCAIWMRLNLEHREDVVRAPGWPRSASPTTAPRPASATSDG